MTMIISAYVINSHHSERTVFMQKSLDVKEKFLFTALTDIKNYPKTLPASVWSVELMGINREHFAHVVDNARRFDFDVHMVYSINSSNLFTERIITGDLNDSKMIIIQLKKTQGHGIPNRGTVILVNLKLKSKGLTSFASDFVSDASIKSIFENYFLDKFVERAKKLEQS